MGGLLNVSQIYYKYLEAEKKLSRKDRVLNNLDKILSEVRGYPYTIGN